MLMIGASLLLPACGRLSTPSMMNTSKPQLVPETTMEQVSVENVSTGYLQNVADNYQRFGTDTLRLSIAYDPDDKAYGAMKAFNQLAEFKSTLKKYGVRSITAETVKTQGTAPTLMISYDSVHAAAPAGCRNMPGFDDGMSTSEIGDYRFGCSVDSMLAQQIYRPSDLNGNSDSDLGDGRRASNSVEYYRQVSPEEAEGELQRMERSDLQE